jgi:hypothetical protein
MSKFEELHYDHKPAEAHLEMAEVDGKEESVADVQVLDQPSYTPAEERKGGCRLGCTDFSADQDGRHYSSSSLLHEHLLISRQGQHWCSQHVCNREATLTPVRE